MASIPRWCQEIVEIVCMFEKELPVSFMDFQVLLLIHLPNEVELVGVVSCCWMLFLNKYIKKLKGFVRQMTNPEGSMAEGYIVYESFQYASEHIKQIDDTPKAVLGQQEGHTPSFSNPDKEESFVKNIQHVYLCVAFSILNIQQVSIFSYFLF